MNARYSLLLIALSATAAVAQTTAQPKPAHAFYNLLESFRVSPQSRYDSAWLRTKLEVRNVVCSSIHSVLQTRDLDSHCEFLANIVNSNGSVLVDAKVALAGEQAAAFRKFITASGESAGIYGDKVTVTFRQEVSGEYATLETADSIYVEHARIDNNYIAANGIREVPAFYVPPYLIHVKNSQSE